MQCGHVIGHLIGTSENRFTGIDNHLTDHIRSSDPASSVECYDDAMDYAELYQKEWAEFQAHTRRSRGLKPAPPASTLDRWKRNLASFFRRTPGQPEDPYAYAMAPKKPRPPLRGASAVAQPPI